jgi:signal recognition particle GTPase
VDLHRHGCRDWPERREDQLGLAARRPVSGLVSGIDAALQPSGMIAGIVTDAVTHRGVAGVPVVVYDTAGRAVTGGCTGTGGAY